MMGPAAPRIYPVIHVESIVQVVNDARTAASCGSAHVFLIDHDADDDRLARAVLEVERLVPQVAIGVNVIRRPATEAMAEMSARLESLRPLWAFWVDSLGLESGLSVRDVDATIASARARHHWHGELFGGVAFKYQAPVALGELPELTRKAGQLDVIPTTSGSATGSAPTPEKLRLMRAGLPKGRLAVASGITPENVGQFMPLVTDILVSTGVSDADGRLDASLLTQLKSEVARQQRRMQPGDQPVSVSQTEYDADHMRDHS